MNDTPYNNLNPDLARDMAAWMRATAGDNRVQLERLRRCLRKARETELTDCQKRVLTLYYDQGMTVKDIAAQLDVVPSTVSRTLHRAHRRLQHCLKYAL